MGCFVDESWSYWVPIVNFIMFYPKEVKVSCLCYLDVNFFKIDFKDEFHHVQTPAFLGVILLFLSNPH